MRSPKQYLPFRFSEHNFVYIYNLFHTCPISRQSNFYKHKSQSVKRGLYNRINMFETYNYNFLK
jgi:hypothetical protein